MGLKTKIVKRAGRTVVFALLLIIFNYNNTIAHIQLIISPPTDSCARWKEWMYGIPQSQEEFKMVRDTLMRFIESCTNSEDSHLAFHHITSSIEKYDVNDTSRFDRYRDWLLSVAFLPTTNPAYFCACVYAMTATYQYQTPHINNTAIAIVRFLLADPNCNDQGLRDSYDQALKSRHEDWLSSADTSIPEDTVIPSLDSIGLGILLHHNAVSPSKTLSPTYLASFTSSPNPFIEETKLRFHLNRMSYVTIEISDLLGRIVWQSKGRTYDIGDHELTIDGKSIPDGILYARISTGFGEVKTVKLVKGTQ